MGWWWSEGQKIPGFTLLQSNWPLASATHALHSLNEKYSVLNETENNGAIPYLISLYKSVFESYRRILLMPAWTRDPCLVQLPCTQPWLFENALYINALYTMHFKTYLCAVINISFKLGLGLSCVNSSLLWPESMLTSEILSEQHCLFHHHHSVNIFRILFPWWPMFPAWYTIMEKGKRSDKILMVYITRFLI